ncbi:MAG: SMP-30/gluconolactonase/LRE family protein [Nannocystaceae bacterium]|nr:SMP-30/gluconolactonase/LRE family protein [Nannocystaceae bacterium]
MNLRWSLGVCLLMVAPSACGDDSKGGTAMGSTGAALTSGGTGPGSSSAEGSSSTGAEGSSTAPDDESGSSSSSGEPSRCWDDLQVGDVEVLFEGFAGGSEGIAFTSDGRLIVTTLDDGVGTLWEISPAGEATVFVEVPYALGLAPRSDGSLVVASLGELMEPDGGVYEVSSDGEATLLTEGIDSANFVAVAPDGSVLVSDDFDTRVFHVQQDGTLTTVIEDVPSPNGIAYSPDNTMFYVASTFSVNGELTRYDVDGDGIPIESSAVEILHTGPGSVNDGIGVDVDGNVYVLANFSGELWRVDGSATELQDGEVLVEGLESPASMAFGRGEDFDPCSAYITELLGPRVVRVALGVEGAALHE